MIKDKVIGQTKDAGFQIGVRKTFEVSTIAAWDFLFSEKGISIWLGHVSTNGVGSEKIYKTREGVEGKINVFKPYSHIRLTWKPKNWTNTSTLQIRVIDANGKSTISFHQDRLLDGKQREAMKIHWDTVMQRVERELGIVKQ